MHERPSYRPGDGLRRPGPLNRGMGGTGRVGDDLYLVAHHEVTGRPQLPRRQLGLGLAGGLVAELLLGGGIWLHRGCVAVTAGAIGPGQDEPLIRRVYGQIAAEPQLYPVRDWLRFLAPAAAGDIAGRLVRAGYLTRAGARMPGRPARYVPVDPDWAFAALVRVRAALRPGRPVTAGEVTLAGLVVASGLSFRFDHDPFPAGVNAGQAIGMLPPDLRELIASTRAAVDSTVLASRT